MVETVEQTLSQTGSQLSEAKARDHEVLEVGGHAAQIPFHVCSQGEFAATKAVAQARERLWAQVLKLYETGLFPGISVCVMHQHQPLLHRSLGYGSLNGVQTQANPAQWLEAGGQPLLTDQPACLFSASKMVTAILIHWLADQGFLDMSSPISRYVPALKTAHLGRLSLEDVLTHRAGIPSFPKGVSFDVLFDPKESLNVLKTLQPNDGQGADFAYHAVTGGVLMGAVIEAVAQMSVQQLLNQVLRRPLGMRFFCYGLPRKQDSGQAVQEYLTGAKPNVLVQQWIKRLVGANLEEVIAVVQDQRFQQTPILAANLYATPKEMCQFLELLLHHGAYGSKQILSPEAVARALKPADKWCLDKQFMLPMRYSAGFMLGANPVGLWGPLSHRSFGHLGFTNKWCWANPLGQTAVCLVSNGNCVASAPIKAMVPFVVEVQRLAALS